MQTHVTIDCKDYVVDTLLIPKAMRSHKDLHYNLNINSLTHQLKEHMNSC